MRSNVMLYGPAPFPRRLPLEKLPFMDEDGDEIDESEVTGPPSPDATITSLKDRIQKVEHELDKARKAAGMIPAWEEELRALEAALEAYERVRAATIVHGT